MSTHSWGTTLSRSLAVYLAASIQITVFAESGPQLLLAVGAWILCGSSPRAGILWALAIGLCLDATAHGRLGLHFATCGVLAAIARATIRSGERPAYWHRPVIAGWLAWGDSVVSQTLRYTLAQAQIDLAAITSPAAITAGQTAAVVWAGVIFLELTRRCLNPNGVRNVVHLENQWSRLTEA